MNESDFPLPPATFEFLVFSLKMQAELRMGILMLPGETEASIDMNAARHTIDMLAMLAEKTKGNLSLEEQRLIENSLTELRFRFVQVTEKANEKSQILTPDGKPADDEEPRIIIP
jgi:hypothetical protein